MADSNISPSTRVAYAMGYLELGLVQEAADELEAIEVDAQLALPITLAWIELHLEAKNWDQLITVAQGLARTAPHQERAWIGWAYGLRSLERVREARLVLLEADCYHGDCALLHYNLACYECLLGETKLAQVRLRRACKLGGKQFRAMALDDPDLQPIWPWLNDPATALI